MTRLHSSLLSAALSACALLAAAAAAHADGTVIVRYGDHGHPSHHVLAAAGVVATVGTVAGTGAHLIRIKGDPAIVAGRLSRTRGVRWAEPNLTMHAEAAAAAPNDPQWNALYGVRRIGAPSFWAAHGLGTFPVGAGGVAIGIVDTGVDTGHEDLAGRVSACAASANGHVTEGACADDEGHGSHVAGTIGALADNGLGVTGVAFSSPLIACRALGGDGSGTVADVAACLRWVHDRGAKVISMSLGGPASRTLAEAAKSAYGRGGRGGSLLVAAAGNDGTGAVEYPAGLPQVISVGAIDSADAIAPFSNENADVEISAPGVGIVSVKAGGGYVAESGTSMATPHVSGAAALLWSADPRASAATIRNRLDAAVDDLGAPGRDPAYGFGVVDLAKAP